MVEAEKSAVILSEHFPEYLWMATGGLGEVQAEILKSLIARRFGVEVSLDRGRVLYKETIAAPVEGVGHYEPLRHYAEVHLILEPLPRGSGLQFASACSEDALDRNWQRLVLTHLGEKMSGQKVFQHVFLRKGERSELSELAAKLL